MKKAGKIFYRCMTLTEEWITMPLMAVAIVVTVVNVLARYILKSALPWSQEVVGIAWTWTCMLGISWCYRRNMHCGVDFFVMKLPANVRRWVSMLAYLILTVAMIFLTYMSIIITINGGYKLTNYFQLPYTVKYVSAIISFFNMTVYSIIYVIKAIMVPEEFVLRLSVDGNGLDELEPPTESDNTQLFTIYMRKRR